MDQRKLQNVEKVVLVCSECKSKKVYKEFCSTVKKSGLQRHVRVHKVSCLNKCKKGPNILVCPDNVIYSSVKAGDVKAILDEVLQSSALEVAV